MFVLLICDTEFEVPDGRWRRSGRVGTWQLAVSGPVGASVQFPPPLKFPGPLEPKLTVSVGALLVPELVSVTVRHARGRLPCHHRPRRAAQARRRRREGSGLTAIVIGKLPVAMVAGVLGDNAPVDGLTSYCDTVSSTSLAT